MSLRSCRVMLSLLSSLLWTSPTSLLPRQSFRLSLIECRYGHQPEQRDSSQVHSYTFSHMPPLLTPATQHVSSVVTTLFVLCVVSDFAIFGRLISRYWCNEACVFTLAHYGLYDCYKELQHNTSPYYPVLRGISHFGYRPNGKIGGLDLHQLLYERLLAYRITLMTRIIKQNV